MRPLPSLIVCLGFLSACGPRTEPGVVFFGTSQTDPLVAASLEFIGDASLSHRVVADPEGEVKSRGGFVVAVVTRDDCTDCYRLDGDGQRFTVTGGAPLGIQYGVAHVLELLGYRFFHPWKTHVPKQLARSGTGALGKEYVPEVDQKRGLHLHTLHPIEPLYDFWMPSDAHREGALRTIDFIIKNRGNYVQWAALDDITKDAAKADAWRAHTAAILEQAHRRGVKVGVGIQLFGKSNLQNAYDLIDEDPDPVPEMKRRLHLLLDGVPFDNINLSFGEFFGADPAVFVQRVNEAYAAMQEVSPGVEVTAVIHLGNSDDLRVSYMGESVQYYFLIRWANPAITPWVHTVMYYDLFEDAGGAYQYDRFDEHRAYLEERLRTGAAVGYYPESAYWIAFDNSVPTYLPLYMRSRFTDLDRLRASGKLRAHLLFSSGWEWGYWQTDAATLRMTYQLPSTWDEPVKDFFAPWGERGAKAAELIRQLGEVQHRGLIEERLAAYVAGRDQLIDAGKKLGIISQPDRVVFEELAAMTAAERASFVTQKLDPLRRLADEVSSLDDQLEAAGLPADDPFMAELLDAFDITAKRIRFVHALYRASVAYLDTGSDGGWLAKADAELEAAKPTVARRRRALHYPDAKSILRDNPNPTFYQYGYLREADSLCFWNRERAEVRRLVLQTGEYVPGCVL